MEKTSEKEQIKKQDLKSKKTKDYDSDASLSAKIIRIIFNLATFGLIIILLGNTWNLAVGSYRTYDSIKKNNIETYAKDFYSRETIYSSIGIVDNKQALEDLKETDSKTYMMYTLYEMVVLEVNILLLLLLYYYLLEFLSVKNLNSVFSDDSLEIINKIIKYCCLVIFIPSILTIIGDIIAFVSQKKYPSFGDGFPTSIIIIFLLSFIIRYIIRSARKQIN